MIGCKELRNMDEEDIKDKLKSQGVTKVERMKRRKDGQLVPSDSYILTINSPNIPPQIKVGFLIRNTKVYIPNPQRCFNCQKYGHNKRFCKNEAKCGQAGHDDHECENEAKCANCNNGDHPAYVRSCPKWKIEKEIIKVKYQKNIPYHEARQQVQSDENEMELNITTPKRAIHEVSSEEEPTSPLPTKRTAPGPLASGQDGTFVPKGARRGGPSKISTFCPNPPRSGGQGSSGRDRSLIRLPEGTKPSVPPKPGNHSKSKNDKNSPY